MRDREIGAVASADNAHRVESWDFQKIRPHTDNEIGIGFQLPSDAMTIKRTRMRAEVTVPHHSHPHDTLLIVFDGDATITSGGNVYPLSHGELLRIPAGVVHGGTFKPGCDFMELGLGVEYSAGH